MMDDDSSPMSTLSFPRFEDLSTFQHRPRTASPTQSPGSLYASTLYTPPMPPSVYEDLSGGRTPTQAAPSLPQLPDFPNLQVFIKSRGSERPVRVQVFPDDGVGTSIPRPRSAIDSLRRRSPTKTALRPLTPDISSLRILTETPEKSTQEQDVTRLGAGSTNMGVRSRYPSEASLVPSLSRFAPQRQRRLHPLSIPGTESTRTSITDCRLSSATSLASRDFAFPSSYDS